MQDLHQQAPAPQPAAARLVQGELRKQMLRERKPLGGGGPRLEIGNTVDTTILNSGAKLVLGGAG
jgi:hypothetical protein